jgi:hypothetical protein
MRALFAGIIALAFLAPAAAWAATPNSQISVNTEGIFSAKNLLVYQKSGSALYCRALWGAAFVRLTVLVPNLATTTILKNHGAAAVLDDIVQGDYINVEGRLETGADTLLVDATKITDLSANREAKSLSGTVSGVNAAAGTFTLADKKLGNTTVVVGTSTITKGVRTISLSEIKKGDKITSAPGSYDYTAKTLAATAVIVYQDPSFFKPRTFEGTVHQLPGGSLPTTIVVSTKDADYQVFLSDTAQILSKSYAPTELSRFAVGDKVRLYGSIRQDNIANLDATILRDLNF